MKLLLIILFAYLTYRFLQRLMFPQKNEGSGFRVIFPDREYSPKEKDISDKGRVVEKGE
ncbi:hypothetical protein [Leptospira johnsonii]|uniref:Uncharacterized protein n=1 Tax=Leptospira johnsonii TaxID=1917820 RepID=A0A2P2D208_9LEPT|nr:hypothetical protein [Leptospira johnsonii]GBF38658.1 hypothetical protein LPTSP1_16510 [Leptospira johnsonii]